ncbi:MAG TPA: arginine--tRNA ligase [Candidatus Dormibacteraeota bacterium]|nr:arginine--tRNA ligase [Candidatus Dormibacteraeota bacterium]
MYITLTKRLREALVAHIQAKYGEALGSVVPNIVLERPPKIEMGEAASPVAFELAKRLKKAPRMIAQEIAAGLGTVEGIARVEVAGAGYLNAYFDRGAFWKVVIEPTDSKSQTAAAAKAKIIVEHTSINPNKAAHIGHVRNAVLGDTFARILKFSRNRVQIQNYIDNTGVQVADVVIGFLQMEKRSPIGVMQLAREPKFDYYCWDLYAKATQLLAHDKPKTEKLRAATLKAIEEGQGEDAEVGQIVADAIVDCHLRTMARLGIGYDLLARESEILHLKFWDTAFEMLKKAGAIELATSGKMAGCWIMPWKKETAEEQDVKEKTGTEGTEDAESTEKGDEHEQDKIIVRSNGVVTYVGKDIAYQLWKFGLLGKDFRYHKWPNTPAGETIWATTSEAGEAGAPNFAEPANAVYNVIDTRQAYVQEVVAEGLRRTGYGAAAEKSIHLSYAMVVLTPRCAADLGYELSPEDARRPFVDMSGRKGLGVKADDLIDKLEAATLAEVHERHADMGERWQKETAHKIAVGALRFFLLKFTRNSLIAFDFKDALSFEGETGPYCQYAVVRIRGIRRKGTETGGETVTLSPETVAAILAGADGNDLWELILHAGALDYAVDAAIGAQEPAFVAKYTFQLAQAFNNFYHKHHILSEEDSQKRAFFLALCGLVETQLVRALDLLGIEAPEKM